MNRDGVSSVPALAATLLALLAVVLPVLSTSEEVRVAPASNLALDAREAAARKVAILLEFSAEYCAYCMQLEAEFLQPMLVSGDYDDKVLMRDVAIDRALPIVDFNGETTTTAALADRFNVDLTPTMVLVDSSGRALAEPIVGLWTPDFFGGVIDERIEFALARLRAREPASLRHFGDDK